ncbi:MAG: CidA/LrgA family protein [Candidatus Thermoplasmatota archaeon]|nr:CidA/LrgA family protein [Candidatus Thermoplasmatota archaeon]MBS3789317.1 CidA/LrgA family protein [Candidatus Thermoplasmatota archaeon]
MYKGLAIIFGFYFLGEVSMELSNLPIPGNVLGMILLVLALGGGMIDLKDVEREAEFFVDNMSIMFIPPGVGIMLYFGLLIDEILPIIGALVLSFIITIVFTGKIVEVLR